MNKKDLESFYIKYGIFCSIMYCIPILVIFANSLFMNFWLLYLGNALFFCLLIFVVIYVNHSLGGSGGFRTLCIAGFKITSVSILTSCILIFLMLTAFRGSIQQLPNIPFSDKNNGMSNILFFNAIFVNLPGGALGSLVGAMSAKQHLKIG